MYQTWYWHFQTNWISIPRLKSSRVSYITPRSYRLLSLLTQRGKPLIRSGRSISEEEVRRRRERSQKHGGWRVNPGPYGESRTEAIIWTSGLEMPTQRLVIWLEQISCRAGSGEDPRRTRAGGLSLRTDGNIFLRFCPLVFGAVDISNVKYMIYIYI